MGDWTGRGGYGDRRPGRLSREDIRQFRGEIRRWSAEAQELRRLLREGDLDPKALDEILRGLRALDDDRVYQDVEELKRLQTFVTEGLKRFEYALRRQVGTDRGDVVLSEHLAFCQGSVASTRGAATQSRATPQPVAPLTLEQVERDLLAQALERTAWNVTRAAKLLMRRPDSGLLPDEQAGDVARLMEHGAAAIRRTLTGAGV